MNQFDIEKKLRKVQPKHLSGKEKGRLWKNIIDKVTGMEMESRGNYSFWLSRLFNSKFAFVVLLIALLAGGSAAAALADNSGPGDLLFPVDLALEKLELSFANNKRRDELKLKFSEERLKEAKIVMRFALGDDQTSFPAGGEATSTSPGNGTSTPLTPTSTPPSISLKSVERAKLALGVALDYLKRTRKEFEERGNAAAVTSLDLTINELTSLADIQVSRIDSISAKIQNNGTGLKLKIDSAGTELKAKFKFEMENRGKGKDEDKDTDKKVDKKDLKSRVSDKDDDDEDEDEDDENEDKESDNKGKDKKITICHIPRGSPQKKHTVSVSQNALDAHLAHGDTRGRCGDDDDDDDDDTATTTPDVLAPVISGINAIVSSSSAKIEWSTNENADSAVWYSTSSPLNVGASPLASSVNFVQNHSVTISGLQASSTYYYIVVSKDLAGNTATSTEKFFIISPAELPDVTPPVISGVTATSLTSTASISWNTDEDSTSSAWYGTSTPFTISGGTLSVNNPNLVKNHILNLTGLLASTTYYYLVSSADAAGNTATSTEQSFLTQ